MFASRVTEESASNLSALALVTLIVVGTRKDDGSVHRYRNLSLFSRKETAECWSVGITAKSRFVTMGDHAVTSIVITRAMFVCARRTSNHCWCWNWYWPGPVRSPRTDRGRPQKYHQV